MDNIILYLIGPCGTTAWWYTKHLQINGTYPIINQLSLNLGQKYCRLLQREHSAILSTFIKLPFVIKLFVLSIFEWPFYTGFIVNP